MLVLPDEGSLFGGSCHALDDLWRDRPVGEKPFFQDPSEEDPIPS